MLILLSLRQRPSRSHNGTIAAAPRLVAMLVLRKIVIWWPIDRHHVRSSLRRRQCGGDRRCSLRRLNGRPSSYRSCKLFTLANVTQALGLGLGLALASSSLRTAFSISRRSRSRCSEPKRVSGGGGAETSARSGNN